MGQLANPKAWGAKFRNIQVSVSVLVSIRSYGGIHAVWQILPAGTRANQLFQQTGHFFH